MNHEEENALHDFLQNQINYVPILLDEELTHKNKKFNHRNDFKGITDIIDDFIKGDNIDRYIVLPGLRGVGKTTILYQIYDYLLNDKKINQNQILYISCDYLKKTMHECDILKAIEYYIREFHNSSIQTLNKEIFLLIDEAHFDKDWSLAGKIIHDLSKKIFMVFTGSSAIKLDFDKESSRRMINQTICPLNFSQYLKLKHDYDAGPMSQSLLNMIFTSEIEDAVILESKINSDLLNLKDYTTDDWENYFRIGGLPLVMHDKNPRKSYRKIFRSVDTVVTKDLGAVKNITTNAEDQALRLLKFLAQKRPGETSQNTLSDIIKAPYSTVGSLLRLLEKTQLIFHYEPYAGANGRARKSWQYYFASPCIRHAINKQFGVSSIKKDDYDGILLENFVASSLFNVMNNENYFDFDTYFQLGKNSVDFIIKKEFDQPIPIEVGLGKKNKNQIKGAMNKLNSSHGIIISNTTKKIEKKDDIIYIPIKTFGLL